MAAGTSSRRTHRKSAHPVFLTARAFSNSHGNVSSTGRSTAVTVFTRSSSARNRQSRASAAGLAAQRSATSALDRDRRSSQLWSIL